MYPLKKSSQENVEMAIHKVSNMPKKGLVATVARSVWGKSIKRASWNKVG